MSTKPTEMEIIKAVESTATHAFYLDHPPIGNSVPDLLGVSIEPTLKISGYEIKRSRTDWLQELRTGKNSSTRQVCDYWWIVALPKVVKTSDLAPEWGLQEFSSDTGLLTIKGAFQLKAETMNREFVTTLFGLLVNHIPKTKWTDEARAEGYRQAMKDLLGFPFLKKHSPESILNLLNAMDSRVSFGFMEELKELQKTADQIKTRVDTLMSGVPSYKDWETNQPLPPDVIALKPWIREELLKKYHILKDDPNFEGIVEYTAKRRYQGYPT